MASPFEEEIAALRRQRDEIAKRVPASEPDQQALLRQEMARINTRCDELLALQHDWAVGALDSVVERLEEIVREETRRMSSLLRGLGNLRDRLLEEDKTHSLAPQAEIAAGRPVVPAHSIQPLPAVGFTSAALADLAESEARRELVLGQDSEAKRYVEAFKEVFAGWRTMPWCAAFLHWCCNRLGAELPLVVPGIAPIGAVQHPTFALAMAWKAWAMKEGWFSSNAAAPRRGDLVVFDWDADGRNDHIGVLLGELDPERLVTAEGNTTNSKGERHSGALRKRRRSLVQGFIRLPDGLRLGA